MMMTKEQVIEIEGRLKDAYKELAQMADIIETTEKMFKIAEDAITDEFQKMVLKGQRIELDKLKQDYQMELHAVNEEAVNLVFGKAALGML